MRHFLGIFIFLFAFAGIGVAQINDYDDGFTIVDNSFNPNRALDSLKASHKKVPKRLRVWTIDERFGDITAQKPDTVQRNFMNSVFTSGMYGEYNYTGNLGAPRISRIATDRDYTPRFGFTEPYSFFLAKPSELRFTNTLSPITHIYYHSCGDKDTGEDYLKALFATNINKQAGFGFKFNYMYGRGYYQNQNTALFDYTMWASYIGSRYSAHLILSWDHMKMAENGGISDDDLITHPEAQSQEFETNEIGTVLNDNWSRNDGFHAMLSHRYSVGFYRKVPMTEDEKEAKRFAMKAKAEQEALEALAKGTLEPVAGRPDNAPVAGNFSGRPDNARVIGDLPTDSISKKKTEELAKELADSLLAKTDSVAEDTVWTKDEYVPVTSFIHTLHLDNHNRTYIAYDTPENYYGNTYDVPKLYADGENIYDETKYFSIRNTFGIGLLEGFNKYVPMGAKIYITHDLRNYKLPNIGNSYSSYNEMDFNAGVQVTKELGNAIHYNATGEICLIGENIGDIRLDGTGDLNVPLSKDTMQLALKAFYHLTKPVFYQRTFHSKHFWWDNGDMNKQMHTHLEAVLSYPKTKTSIRFAYDNLQNYVYLAESYNRDEKKYITGFTAAYRQSSKNISLLTLMLEQNMRYGILNWENRVTFQQSTDNDILPVPSLNVWTNLYINFKLAKVLRVQFGAEAFWFTKYNAPEYCSQLGQYAVQENSAVKTETGNYPIVNAYMNFKLKQCRFYVMMSHLNAGMGNRNYFLTPHHPLNESVFRMGLSWTFNN